MAGRGFEDLGHTHGGQVGVPDKVRQGTGAAGQGHGCGQG